MTRCAVLSDIHGNATALQAVLADIEGRGIEILFCLGDLVGKGPQSGKVVDLCRDRCDIVVKGNWDDFLSEENQPEVGAHGQWVREQLGRTRLEYLRQLPECHEFLLGGRAIRLFHSSSTGIHHRVPMNSPMEDHLRMFENTPFTGSRIQPDVVGYGDIHTAYLKHLGSKVLFNTGSVGNPLDLNQASYVVLEESGAHGSKSLQVSFLRVAYDVEEEVHVANASGMPDRDLYIRELMTAKYRGSPA